MKIIRVLPIFFLFCETLSEENPTSFNCSHLHDLTEEKYANLRRVGAFEGKIKGWNYLRVTNYLSTNGNRNQVNIDIDDWSVLYDCVFDVNKETIIIIHGLMSGATQPWVKRMKDALLNVALREHLKKLKITKKDVQWNKLYFIGHSLGAHISAQTAHLLKIEKFWQINRITGLDPAGPCFHESNVFRRLDSKDADFVDIIHTQSQNFYFSLGTNNLVGDADFYVNGGMSQPDCEIKDPLLNDLAKTYSPEVIKYYVGSPCSHGLAQEYFTESITSKKIRTCRFEAQPWNGNSELANIMKDQRLKGELHSKYPEMGYYATKAEAKGVYLVITGASPPYCAVGRKDKIILDEVYERLKILGQEVNDEVDQIPSPDDVENFSSTLNKNATTISPKVDLLK